MLLLIFTYFSSFLMFMCSFNSLAFFSFCFYFFIISFYFNKYLCQVSSFLSSSCFLRNSKSGTLPWFSFTLSAFLSLITTELAKPLSIFSCTF